MLTFTPICYDRVIGPIRAITVLLAQITPQSLIIPIMLNLLLLNPKDLAKIGPVLALFYTMRNIVA